MARSKIVVTSVPGNVQPFQSTQTGLQKLTDLYIQQMQFLLPVLWVESNTPIRVVFQEPVSLPGLPTSILVSQRGN